MALNLAPPVLSPNAGLPALFVPAKAHSMVGHALAVPFQAQLFPGEQSSPDRPSLSAAQLRDQRNRTAFSTALDGPARYNFRGSSLSFNLQPSQRARTNRFDLSATAAFRQGSAGAFLSANGDGLLRAGFGSMSNRMFLPAGRGTRPAPILAGPPGTNGDSKHPTASVTVRLSF